MTTTRKTTRNGCGCAAKKAPARILGLFSPKERDQRLIQAFDSKHYRAGQIIPTNSVCTKHILINKINRDTVRCTVVNQDGTRPEFLKDRTFLLEKKYIH